MKAKNWLIGWGIIVLSALSFMGYRVWRIDPYFHYHKPDTGKYFYLLNNQRSQNNGICRHFDYDSMITGTSMTENFRTSEAEKIYGGHFIKITNSGASFKEVNDNLDTAFGTNPDIKTVIRCLDMLRFFDASDFMRSDLGVFPEYLYDDIPFNDVKYLLNRDVIFGRVYKMERDAETEGFQPGITTFDEFSRWLPDEYKYGINSVCPEGLTATRPKEQPGLTDDEKAKIKENIELNVTGAADAHPDTDFYIYYSPYSIVQWNVWADAGMFRKVCEAEDYITELILEHDNIHLFSFNDRTDIITDLNQYKDQYHYGPWINSLILKWMHDGSSQLTRDNYKERLQQEHDFFASFDYTGINGQEDYEADYYAAASLNKELTGADPMDLLNADNVKVTLNAASYKTEGGSNTAVDCKGRLNRDPSERLRDHLKNKEFIGVKLEVDLDQGYNYLCFDGLQIKKDGYPVVYVWDENGNPIDTSYVKPSDSSLKKHHFAVDLSAVSGTVTIILNGGGTDKTASTDSEYLFSNIYLY